MTIKRRAAIGPRKRVSWEKPGLDIGLKIPKKEKADEYVNSVWLTLHQ